MKNAVTILALAVAIGAGAAHAQDLQAKVAAAKQAAALNQQALRSYSWVQKTEIVLKGEVKNTKLESCRYGSGGEVIEVPISEPPPAEKKRGLKGKVIEKKTGEMKAEMEAAAALVKKYLPPSPEKIQAALGASRVMIVPGATTTVRIADYEKAGDSLVLTLDGADKALAQVAVSSWMDTPSDTVSLSVGMQAVVGGPSFVGKVTLAIPGRNLEVRITNSNYQKLAQ